MTPQYKKYLGFTLFFVILFILNLVFLDVMTSYRGVAKTLIMASLLGFYIAYVVKQDQGFLLAMIFALFGDVFLLFEGKTFFLIGLVCFLIMQVLYSITFYRDRGLRRLVWWFVPIVLIAMCVAIYLMPQLGDMKIAVCAYSLAITLMAYFGIHRDPSSPGYAWVSGGVILFIISDMALAYSTFVGPYPGDNYLIMITYMIAQYTIVRGIVMANEEG
jgi:uncharacterized membrane protein YhhN